MKKFASLVLALTMAFGCVGCWGNNKSSSKSRSMPMPRSTTSQPPFYENGSTSTHPSDAYFNSEWDESVSEKPLTEN